ncbi:3124_t:CDS:2, partial [Gigaspora rosea]
REEETKDPEDCYRFGIGEEDRKNENGINEFWKLGREKDQKKDVKKLTEKKNLDDICESWIKKVEAFRRMNDFKETKGPTEKEYAKIKETSYASDCYQKEIEVEKYENKRDSSKLRKEKNVPER